MPIEQHLNDGQSLAQHHPAELPPAKEVSSGVRDKDPNEPKTASEVINELLKLEDSELFEPDPDNPKGEIFSERAAKMLESLVNRVGIQSLHDAVSRLDCDPNDANKRYCMRFKYSFLKTLAEFEKRQESSVENPEPAPEVAPEAPVERTPELKALREFLTKCEKEIHKLDFGLKDSHGKDRKEEMFKILWNIAKHPDIVKTPKKLDAKEFVDSILIFVILEERKLAQANKAA